jgi:hypothetical protein
MTALVLRNERRRCLSLLLAEGDMREPLINV